ncbi:MAG: hypothetical protein JSU07_05710 [Bacteroidetes bacterium]|nr:hypothetical protein [Bacteroidota bacterium]
MHSFLVINYFFINEKPNKKIDYYSYFYIYPYLHQQWRMFASVPKYNYAIVVEINGKKKDIFTELTYKHQHNRFLGLDGQVIALGNIIHYFIFSNNTTTNKTYINSKNFTILNTFIQNYCTSSYHVKNVKFCLIATNVITHQINFFKNY